mmetsp:Transcript_54571/g.118739  ORF Transcript_54571/g.118739 Transcript_54571/m.118739 type:complete len:241 (+) Transcript_54571:300-1022(+)
MRRWRLCGRVYLLGVTTTTATTTATTTTTMSYWLASPSTARSCQRVPPRVHRVVWQLCPRALSVSRSLCSMVPAVSWTLPHPSPWPLMPLTPLPPHRPVSPGCGKTHRIHPPPSATSSLGCWRWYWRWVTSSTLPHPTTPTPLGSDWVFSASWQSSSPTTGKPTLHAGCWSTSSGSTALWCPCRTSWTASQQPPKSIGKRHLGLSRSYGVGWRTFDVLWRSRRSMTTTMLATNLPPTRRC